MTDIAKIAAGLTDAQRKTLTLCRQNNVGHWLIPTYRDMGRMRMALETLKLCNSVGRLTRTGLAVRDYLRDQNDG